MPRGVFDNLDESQLKEMYERELELFNEINKEIKKYKSMPKQPGPPKYFPERHVPLLPSKEQMDKETIDMIQILSKEGVDYLYKTSFKYLFYQNV